jgi:secreted Zn-dependent insulinase-like peptidase
MTILQSKYWNMVERQKALSDIKREDVLDFCSNIFPDGCFVEGLVMGNVSLQV